MFPLPQVEGEPISRLPRRSSVESMSRLSGFHRGKSDFPIRKHSVTSPADREGRRSCKQKLRLLRLAGTFFGWGLALEGSCSLACGSRSNGGYQSGPVDALFRPFIGCLGSVVVYACWLTGGIAAIR